MSTAASGVEPASPADAWHFAERFAAVAANVGRAIRGKPEVVRLVLVAVCCEGHVLVDDVPGVGKTSLARAIAESLDASWHRVQFTPDLLPSDVTGVSIWHQGEQCFRFHPGPVFANVVLADEINRASPRTQSALLEVMEERQVTVDAEVHAVPRPFTVIATQNPVEMEGTYRLPEAQLDRFLIRTSIGYPDPRAELEILGERGGDPPRLRPVLSVDEARAMVAIVERVHAATAVQAYVVRLVGATRTDPGVRLGASPRGALALLRAARALAASDGRAYVTPEDVKAMAAPVLAHRLILSSAADMSGQTAELVVDRLVDAVPAPQPGSGR